MSRVLVVEDEMIVAMMLEDMLTDLGHEVVETAMRLPQAMEAARTADIEIAILDVNLDGTTSYAIAEALDARNVPVIFASGYGSSGLEPAYRDRPTLMKPFLSSDLARAIERTLAGAA